MMSVEMATKVGQRAAEGALSPGLVSRAYKRLLEMHFRAGVGHIGGNLSALDALLVLHHQLMAPKDVFVLAKGHAAGALYITLWMLGRISDQELDTFHQDGTLLSAHPAPGWSRDIPFATGSLGHGLPDAAGMALGYKLQSLQNEVFCLTSDGEWQEGSNWEALIFAIHQKLTNLTIIIDANRLQGFGTTGGVASMDWRCTAWSRPGPSNSGSQNRKGPRSFVYGERHGMALPPAEPGTVPEGAAGD
jgi:transketolase